MNTFNTNNTDECLIQITLMNTFNTNNTDEYV